MYLTAPTDVHAQRDLLVRLWADNLPIQGSPSAKLRWFYCDGPHGGGRAFVVSARDTAVGCAGIGVRALYDRGRLRRAALFADLAIDREHRSGLPAVALLRSISTAVARDFDLGYGFPNRKAIAVYRRAGYRELGAMHRYVRVLRSRRYLREAVGSVASWPLAAVADSALDAIARARAAAARGVALAWPRDFDDRFDRLWQRARDRDVFACERTSTFLRWRLAREPHAIAALTAPDGELRAYAVLRPSARLAELLDLFAADPGDVDALLAHLVPAARVRGYAALSVRFFGSPRVRALLDAHGFAPRGEPRPIVVCGADVPAVERWHLTELDEDT
jgi:hypothetical protein